MNFNKPGFWPSEISEESLSRFSAKTLGIFSDGKRLYKLENLPEKSGVNKLFLREGSQWVPVLPEFLDAASKVHEYGGGAVRVGFDSLAVVNRRDQQIYLGKHDGKFARFTDLPDSRFADPDFSSKGFLAAVEEDHGPKGKPEASISVFDIKTGGVSCRIAGADFYSNPRFSPDGQRILWLQWNFPDMPWDHTELWTADFREGKIENSRCIAGQSGEAVFQPEWMGNQDILFVDDRSNWGNLYRYKNGETQALLPKDKDFSKPPWVFGLTGYHVLERKKVLYSYCDEGFWKLGVLDLESGLAKDFRHRFADIVSTAVCRQSLYALVCKTDAFPTILKLDIENLLTEELEESKPLNFEPSRPLAVNIPIDGENRVHGFYYPPLNPKHSVCEGEGIPYLMKIHGGPTSMASASLNISTQYWTGRGFGFLDLNYRGSTGFGRRYREKLYGQWGISDADDYIAAAQWLKKADLPEASKIFVRGSSSGGYTVLRILTLSDLFSAAACYYGISDLKSLSAETHKFESLYDQRLLGAAKGKNDPYRQRSPIHQADKICVPVIFFQGAEDKVVPPNQTRAIFDKIRTKLPISEYTLYPGEGHGFRKIENQIDSLKKELAFYQKILSGT